jgi:hypothetical protein
MRGADASGRQRLMSAFIARRSRSYERDGDEAMTGVSVQGRVLGLRTRSPARPRRRTASRTRPRRCVERDRPDLTIAFTVGVKTTHLSCADTGWRTPPSLEPLPIRVTRRTRAIRATSRSRQPHRAERDHRGSEAVFIARAPEPPALPPAHCRRSTRGPAGAIGKDASSGARPQKPAHHRRSGDGPASGGRPRRP